MQRTIALTLLFATSTLQAAEPQMQIATSRGPHYVGEGVVIQFTIAGFEGESDPKVEYESITPGLRAKLASISPQVSEMISNINGRVTRTRRVTFQITYQVTADEPGEYRIGPFSISQDGQAVQGQQVSFEFLAVEDDPDMRIRQLLPNKPLYPGERVEVGIEWWYVKDKASEVFPPRISSLLFDQFQFIDKPGEVIDSRSRGSQQQLLPIETAGGQVALPAKVREETDGDKTYLVVSAKRTMVVGEPGNYELPPIAATVRKVTKWARRRSFIGRVRDVAVADKPMRAIGEAQSVEVKPLPLTDRPESFAGAVGDNFSIDVTANRTVVRVGDPITLDVAVRGTGNLDNASLPPLSANNGMDPQRFRLPQDDVTGQFDGETKRFRVNVRVNEEGVSEIPALAYSWFDPRTEAYKTARSKPIALSVGKAKIVSARDVVSSAPSVVSHADPIDSVQAASETQAGQDDPHGDSFVGADLSIISDVAALKTNAKNRTLWLQPLFYVVGLIAIAVALWDRRRHDVDPIVANRRRVLRQQKQTIVAAGSKPRRDAAGEVADALRTLIAEMPNVDRRKTERIIAQCESIIYERESNGGGRLDANLLADASSIADQFIKDAE